MLLPLFLMSCLNKDNNIVSLLKEWDQKEILFPKEMYFTTMLRDTTYYNLQSEYKILAYVDSIGCTSCKLQLSAWSMLINEIDSLYAGRVKFIFAFSPNRIKDIYHAILTANFTYPVYVDKQDSIAKLNRFPLESNLHTFLLDKNNRVIAVGNPVYNPKIKKLYFNIISGKKPFLPCNAEQRTNASLDKRFLDMGSFNWKQEQISDIILSNSGEELLAIEDVSASCGCITVEYLKEPIRPGQKLNLRIKYKAEHPEHFDKTVIIYCNAEGSPFRLKISGNAK